MPRWEITVYGRVQGVGFRYFVKHCAERMGVYGFVRNLSNGTVYVHAEAEDSALESFCQLLQQGNSYSRVEKLSIDKLDSILKYHDFEIR